MPNIIGIIICTYIAGIWFASDCSVYLPLLYSSVSLVICSIAWRLYAQKSIIWPVACLFFCLGILRFIHDETRDSRDISKYIGQNVTLEGDIKNIPEVTILEDGKNKVRYILAISSGKKSDKDPLPIVGAIYISVTQSQDMPVPRVGDAVRVTGEVRELYGYNNPAQYDSVGAAKRQGIGASMSTQKQEIKNWVGKKSLTYRQKLGNWREEILNNMKRVMPKEHAAILGGMLFGGYQGIPKDIVADFVTTGIVHILSVSGSHIALVVGVITVLGTFLARCFSLPGSIVPLLSAGIVTFYAVFCGLTPPVLRSLIMGLIALLAVCFEREKDAGNGLFLTALGMLIYQPSLLYDVSFQLSFASTGGLVFLYTKTVQAMHALPSPFSKLLAVTITAQLGVLPVVAWYFNSFSLSSFLSNIIIVPLIEGIVVLGLFGAVTGMVVGIVGNIVMVICSLLISIVITCNSWLASLPGATLYMPSIGIAGGSLYYILLAWVYGYKPKNMLSLTEVITRWPKESASVVLSITMLVFSYSLCPKPVAVHFIDVGQGDATLIITPHGRAVIIDTGGLVGATEFDIGERVVLPYLKHYGVLAIDYLFLTHGHQDHAGGAAAIAKALPVRNSIVAREKYTQAVSKLVRADKNNCIIPVYEGQEIRLDGVCIKVIHGEGEDGFRQNNEVSSVVQISYGKHSFLLTGDLTGQGEETILASGKNVQSTVLKVGHHGAKSSTTSAFLQAVTPEYAVISVGKNNSFGHPHPETIQRLVDENSKIYRTDQQGAIVFKTDGKKIIVDTFIPSGREGV